MAVISPRDHLELSCPIPLGVEGMPASAVCQAVTYRTLLQREAWLGLWLGSSVRSADCSPLGLAFLGQACASPGLNITPVEAVP